MRALIQRVSRARVKLPDGAVRPVGKGLVIFLGVGKEDSENDAGRLADKIAGLRIFSNEDGKFDLSLADVKGEALVVSQFTLYADCGKGRRPDFTSAGAPGESKRLYEHFTGLLKSRGVPVSAGEFGSHMEVEIINDGPVTIWLDSKGPGEKG